MRLLLFFGAWFVVTQVADFLMLFGTAMFVGPQEFDHWVYQAIMIVINIKIYFIMDKHIKLTDVTKD